MSKNIEKAPAQTEHENESRNRQDSIGKQLENGSVFYKARDIKKLLNAKFVTIGKYGIFVTYYK